MEQQQTTVCDVLSVIAYLRNFFSEASFRTTALRGMRMKTIVSTPETRKFLQWIDAVQAQISDIHRLVLGVYRKSGAKGTDLVLLEAYNIDVHSISDIRAVCLGLQRMERLRQTVVIRIKVFSYVPVKLPGFRAAVNSDQWRAEGDSRRVAEGVSVYIHAGNKAGTFKSGGNNYSLKTKNVEASQKATVSYKANANTTAPESIRCTCLIQETDGDMVQCDKCRNWLHTVCCGFFSNQDSRIPRTFACLLCTGPLTTGQRNLSIFRRALGAVYNEERCGLEYLHRRLSVPWSMAAALLKKLKADGFVARAKVGYKIVKDSAAKERVKEYFSGAKLECSISVEEIEVDPQE
ncbi:hypothetical protein PAPHI01_1455 [Pancytospora philotis]|nr:hypothetical protein PAPHI01_1455 [Pancytospora philotis]